MKDINFDELDKAVNSVLEGGGPTSDAPGVDDTSASDNKPSDKPAEVASEKPAPEAEPVKTPEKPAEPKSAPAAAEATPAISSPVDKGRRSGRFMDVVHPSTSKKTELISTKGPKTLKPLNADVKPDDLPAKEPEQSVSEEPAVEPSEPATDHPKPEPAKEPATPPAEPDTKPAEVSRPSDQPAVSEAPDNGQAWPDPLDVHGFKYDEDSDKKDHEASDSSAPKPDESPADTQPKEADKQEAEDKPAADAQADGSTAPFISDAKVEKRPLGAFSSAKPVTDEAPAEEKPKEEALEVNAPEDLQAPASIPDKLPPELSEEVLAVEGGEFSDHTPAKPEPETKPEEDEDKEEEPKTTLVVEGTGPAVSAAGSILQQYKEHEGESDKPHGQEHNMLATQDHETPLLEPAHHSKHAALWIVLAIIILLATGAGFAWWFLIATA